MRYTWRLVRRTTDKVVISELILADHFWPRLAGLQFRRRLPPGAGVLLVPCRSIHTCFVRFPIDLVYLDGQGQVLGVRKGLRPWRAAIAPAGTHAILETPAGDVEIEVGEVLAVLASDDQKAKLPRSLRFLAGVETDLPLPPGDGRGEGKRD
jgi:uncharacterized membrane protein (UPF0127 family)